MYSKMSLIDDYIYQEHSLLLRVPNVLIAMREHGHQLLDRRQSTHA